MEHKRMPRGAKQVSQWVETSSEAYPKGYGEVTVCYYEADIAYDGGNFTAPAVKVIVYDNGKQIYKQAFYGETADMDAHRHGNEHVTKSIYDLV